MKTEDRLWILEEGTEEEVQPKDKSKNMFKKKLKVLFIQLLKLT